MSSRRARHSRRSCDDRRGPDALLKASGIEFDALQDVPPGVREALDRGDTILAIRRFREATGAGLKEAKDFVDEVRRRQPSASQ